MLYAWTNRRMNDEDSSCQSAYYEFMILLVFILFHSIIHNNNHTEMLTNVHNDLSKKQYSVVMKIDALMSLFRSESSSTRHFHQRLILIRT